MSITSEALDALVSGPELARMAHSDRAILGDLERRELVVGIRCALRRVGNPQVLADFDAALPGYTDMQLRSIASANGCKRRWP